MKILVVDDYADFRVTLALALAGLGYEAKGCAAGEAVVAAGVAAPDVVLIELTREAAALIAELRRVSGPVLVIGTVTDAQFDSHGLETVATLIKPFSMHELQLVLTRHAVRSEELS